MHNAFVKKYTMISALKQGIAHYGDVPQRETVRPPLLELANQQAASLVSELAEIGFTMPGPKESRAAPPA